MSRSPERADLVAAGALPGRRSEEDAFALLDALFANAPVGLAFWDTELRYQRVNAALAVINGPSPEEHRGRTLTELLGELGEQVAPLLRLVMDTGDPLLDLEVTGETPAQPGVPRVWLASYYPVKTATGTLIGVGALVLEVTAERRMQEEHSQLVRDALLARAQAQAAQVRADSEREDAELARAEAEAARRRTEFLARATAQMSGSMDYETTLRRVARSAVPAVADWCAISTIEANGGLRTLSVAHADAGREAMATELLRRYPPGVDDPVGAAAVVRTGQLELISDITDEMLTSFAQDDEHLRLLRGLHLRASLAVPLTSPTRTLGVLHLVCAESGRRFGDGDVALAEALAARAALAIENARLYTERSNIARTLQQGLAPPRLPSIPGLELAARYRAVGDQNEVGGDFYDVFDSGRGAWTAFLGDVAGKGAAAAATTALARHTLRAAALRDTSPLRNLALLNEALLAQPEAISRFCTVVYASIAPEEHGGGATITLCNGGHQPPILLHADGRVERVEGHGSLVGALPDAEWEERDMRLGPGDLLLLYTDGVVELRSLEPIDGEAALDRVLAGMAGASAEEVVGAVESSAVELQDGEPRDDIAIVAMRVPV